MAFLHDEPAAEEVEKLLVKAADDKHKLLLCVVNWGEIYYSITRAEGQPMLRVHLKPVGTAARLPIEDQFPALRVHAAVRIQIEAPEFARAAGHVVVVVGDEQVPVAR